MISLKRNKEEFVAKKNLSRVSGHSFFEYLISKEGVCLDVGCRDFDFSNHVKDLCQKVVAIDPGFNIKPPENKKIIFLNQALTTVNVNNVYLITDGRLGSHHVSMENVSSTCKRVPNITLDNLMRTLQLKELELIKLDCEGSEYGLMWWLADHPVAKQISVQFHDWCGRNPLEKNEIYYERLFNKLKRNYFVVKHERNQKHNKEWNYDDSLFVRK